MMEALDRERFPSISESPPREEEQLSLRRQQSIDSDEEGKTDLQAMNYTVPAPLLTPINHRTSSSGSLTSSLSTSSGLTGPSELQSVHPTRPSIPRTVTGRSSAFSFSTQDTGLFEARALGPESMDFYQAGQDRFVAGIYETSLTKDPGTAVMDAVSHAMQQLQQIRLRDQLHRPLRYEPRDKFHQPDAELVREFDSLAHDGLRVQRLTTNNWLRIAVWWLLKVYISSLDITPGVIAR